MIKSCEVYDLDVMIEIQHAVNNANPRGVGNYAVRLTCELLKRQRYEYGLSFFKHGYEQTDRLARARQLFGNARLFECDTLDYSEALRDDAVFAQKSYEDYINGDAKLFHFMNIISIPTHIRARMLVTVQDLNWLYHDEACSPVIHELVRIGWRRVKEVRPHLIAISENTKREILENSSYGENEISVIYPGYNTAACYPDHNTDILREYGVKKGGYLFFVGVFERKKNIVSVVEIFNILARKHNTLKLVLAGKPTWDDSSGIYAAIEASPFADRIITPGYVSEDVKRVLYSNASLFIFPSICEGFGIPILEAFACGCPVLTANHPTMRETGGEAVLTGDALDPQELADKADAVLDGGNIRRQMVDRGFRRARQFSWEKTAEQVEFIYQKLLEECKA